jgi:arylsulfatase A-like enzyme
MTDEAIDWIRQQKALTPDKPFFIYFAPGAMHAPHHVPPEWSERYRGRFDDGWDHPVRAVVGELRWSVCSERFNPAPRPRTWTT